LRLVALVESVDHVCCRYRLAPFCATLACAGHHLAIRPLPRSPFGRLAIGYGLDESEAIIVQRKLLPVWVVELLRRRVRKLIFDFDDAVWLRDSYSSRGFVDPKRARRFEAIVRACDLVIAGNEYLAAEAARHTAADRVIVIPTCVEPSKYTVSQHANYRNVQLVWVGSASTLRGLEQFKETLSAVGQGIPGIRLKLICDKFMQIPNLAVDACMWKQETEAEDIAAADIGISWVPDDPWSRGKCGLKILQYQAAGLPVVANPVGVHRDMVRDGETGFAANSTEEWVRALTRLANEPGLRLRLGSAGRRQLEDRYSVMAGTQSWLTALERLAGIAQLRKSG
jgi:glycosyltransferase involved in cell wall biosynthesis